jgi:hypothetical protein
MLFLTIKSNAKHKYVDTFTNKYLFSLKKSQLNHSDTVDFIKQLDERIENSKNDNATYKNILDHASKQILLNNTYLDSLYNAGMVDEFMYKRISDNINQEASVENDFRHLADVIYLSSSK